MVDLDATQITKNVMYAYLGQAEYCKEFAAQVSMTPESRLF